jgi:hypothetical protein
MREASKLAANRTLQLMLKVIKGRSPLQQHRSSLGISSEDKAQLLGQIEGHAMCLDDFRLMFEEPKAPIQQIVSKFAPPPPSK